MNREDIIRMAREAGIDWSGQSAEDVLVRAMHIAYTAGAAAEREACAKVCEEGMDTEHPTVKGHIMKAFGKSSLLAAAIRARSSNE